MNSPPDGRAPAAVTGAGERRHGTPTDFRVTGFADLLEVTGHEPHERIPLLWTKLDGFKASRVLTVAEAPEFAASLAVCDVWYGVNPRHERVPVDKKGFAKDVVGVRECYVDLDVKPGGMPSYDAANAVIGELSAMLGEPPAYVVHSGHGLQPHWTVERADDTDWTDETDERWLDAAAIYRRWGRLVSRVAQAHGGAVDGVWNLDRVLRVPGTTNRKDPAAPIPALGIIGSGAEVSLKRFTEVLDEYDVPEADTDRRIPGVVVSPPTEWTFAETTCNYARTVIDGWATEDLSKGRHPWLGDKLVRLAGLHRLGCITETDHQHGLDVAVSRFRWGLQHQGTPRAEGRDEVAQLLQFGIERASEGTDAELREREFGGHVHERGEPFAGILPTGTEITPSIPSTAVAVRNELPSPANPMKVAGHIWQEWLLGGLPLRWHWRGTWYEWRASHWRECEQRAIRSLLYRRTEHAVYQDCKPPKSGGKPECVQVPWAPNRNRVTNLEEALVAYLLLPEGTDPPSWLSGATGGTVQATPNEMPLVACRNGLVDVATRQIRRHTPAYFNLTAVPFDYDPEAPEPRRWLDFVNQLWPDDPESIATLRRWFGYVLSGRTDLQAILLVVGPRRSGKGTIARVLRTLVGEHNFAGPTLASLGSNFGLSSLIGKSLAIISDARIPNRDTQLIVERLLTISGEDVVDVDRKHRDIWTGRLPTRLMIVSNELPALADLSGTIASRFVHLTTVDTFIGREDRGLFADLTRELPGILNWALDGLADLNSGIRLTTPTAAAGSLIDLEDSASPTTAFVRDYCEIGDVTTHSVVVDDLYRAWRHYCYLTGREHPGSAQGFGRAIRAVVPTLKVHRPHGQPRRYLGIRLGANVSLHEDRGGSRFVRFSDDGEPMPTADSVLMTEDGEPR